MYRPNCYPPVDVVRLVTLDGIVGRGQVDRYGMRFVKVAAKTARGYDETHKATGLPSLAWRQDAAAVTPAMTITTQPPARVEDSFAAPERGTQIP